MVLKIKSVLSVHAPMVLDFFCYLVMDKIKVKVIFLAVKMQKIKKHLRYTEITDLI
jgi:hypothetical protein